MLKIQSNLKEILSKVNNNMNGNNINTNIYDTDIKINDNKYYRLFIEGNKLSKNILENKKEDTINILNKVKIKPDNENKLKILISNRFFNMKYINIKNNNILNKLEFNNKFIDENTENIFNHYIYVTINNFKFLIIPFNKEINLDNIKLISYNLLPISLINKENIKNWMNNKIFTKYNFNNLELNKEEINSILFPEGIEEYIFIPLTFKNKLLEIDKNKYKKIKLVKYVVNDFFVIYIEKYNLYASFIFKNSFLKKMELTTNMRKEIFERKLNEIKEKIIREKISELIYHKRISTDELDNNEKYNNYMEMIFETKYVKNEEYEKLIRKYLKIKDDNENINPIISIAEAIFTFNAPENIFDEDILEDIENIN